MKSAHECLQHAATCERMARVSSLHKSRLLREAARHWRALGKAAEAAEKLTPRPEAPPAISRGQRYSGPRYSGT
jgi:hypothetical protein